MEFLILHLLILGCIKRHGRHIGLLRKSSKLLTFLVVLVEIQVVFSVGHVYALYFNDLRFGNLRSSFWFAIHGISGSANHSRGNWRSFLWFVLGGSVHFTSLHHLVKSALVAWFYLSSALCQSIALLPTDGTVRLSTIPVVSLCILSKYGILEVGSAVDYFLARRIRCEVAANLRPLLPRRRLSINDIGRTQYLSKVFWDLNDFIRVYGIILFFYLDVCVFKVIIYFQISGCVGILAVSELP